MAETSYYTVEYTYIDSSGSTRSGSSTIAASSPGDAKDQVRSLGYKNLRIDNCYKS